MKRIMAMILIICLVMVPFLETRASFTPTPFEDELLPGDVVSVHVIGDDAAGRREFTVIKPSPAGVEMVWMIYNGVLGQSPFDETNPALIPPHFAQVTGWETNDLLGVLFANSTAPWAARANTIRLPNLGDFQDLGIDIQQDAVSGVISGNREIHENRVFMAPRRFSQTNPQRYNFWTDICDPCTATGPADIVNVGLVTYNETRAGNLALPAATIEMISISGIPAAGSPAPTFSLRPVIEISKNYIVCRTTGQTTEPTTQPDCPPECPMGTPYPGPDGVDCPPHCLVPVNPPTNEVFFPIELFAILVVAGVTYKVIRKKAVFDKI